MPWAFDDEAVDALRRFTRLKMSLMPYLAVAAEDAHTQDRPDYDWTAGLRLRVFSAELSRTTTVEVPDGRGGTAASIDEVAQGSALARLVSGHATFEVDVVP